MAQKVVVSLVSDLSDTGETEDDKVGTVNFGLDGTDYEMELTDSEQVSLRDVFAPYIKAGRKLGRNTQSAPKTGGRRADTTPRSTAPRIDREQAQAIREWARQHGVASDRGRVPNDIRDAYHRGDSALLSARDRGSADAGASSPTPRPQHPEPSTEQSTGQPAERAPSASAEETSTADTRVGRDGLTRDRREAIRTWAKVQGMEVKDRGILRKDTIQDANAWENTHGSLDVTPAESATS